MDMRWGVLICIPHSAKCFSFSLRDLNMLAGIYIGCFIQSISHTYYNEFQSVWYEFTNGNDKKTKNVKVIQRKAKIIFLPFSFYSTDRNHVVLELSTHELSLSIHSMILLNGSLSNVGYFISKELLYYPEQIKAVLWGYDDCD